MKKLLIVLVGMSLVGCTTTSFPPITEAEMLEHEERLDRMPDSAPQGLTILKVEF